MPYGYITRAQLRAQIAERLSDSFNIFWTASELNLYINEALQTFSSFSAFWRIRASFNTTSAVFYDLPTNLPSACGYNVEDITLIPEMCYQLIEPVPTGLGTMGAAWAGTDMFNLDDLTQALQRRRDQFLADTGMVVTHFTKPMPSPPQSRVTLPDNVIDVRRAQWAAYQTGTPYGYGYYGAGPYGGAIQNAYNNLWRMTEWQLTTQTQGWNINPANPYGFAIVSSPPLTIQVGPAPPVSALLDLVTVNAGAPLNPQAGVLMGIPDDFCWIVKWGALADLLGMDGQARDPQRAQFCEDRYQLGVRLAKESALVLQCLVGNNPQIVGSVRGLDSLNPGWQGAIPGPVQSVMVAGRNLIAVNPPPSGTNSLSFDVVENAPLPTDDSDLIQIGREQLDGIIDYAEHLACFKMGGAEFQMTMRQADNFLRQAANYNQRLSAASLFSVPTGDQSRNMDIRYPRMMAGKALNG